MIQTAQVQVLRLLIKGAGKRLRKPCLPEQITQNKIITNIYIPLWII